MQINNQNKIYIHGKIKTQDSKNNKIYLVYK